MAMPIGSYRPRHRTRSTPKALTPDAVQAALPPSAAHNLAVAWLPTAELTFDSRSARRHPKKQITQLAASIKLYGFNVPVLVDPTGKIISGQARVLAANELGRERVPTICITHLNAQQIAGSTLDPDRVPVEVAQDVSRTVGSFVYSAQYQQDPQPAEGTLLRLGNVGRYSEPHRDYDEIVISVDTAMETGESNDYTACIVLGRFGHRIHVLRVERHKIPFVEQLMLVRDLTREYPSAQVVVEAANSGIALIQVLRRDYAMHVTAARVRLSKEARAIVVAPMLENGDVYLPEHAEWLDAFVRELRVFPHGANDDMVDAFVHGLRFLKRHIDRIRERPYPAPDQRRIAAARPRGNVRPPGAPLRR